MLLLSVLWCHPLRAQAQQGVAALPPVNAAAIAERIVKALAPQRGERALIFYDPAYYPEITHETEARLLRAGAHPVLLLAFDPPETVAEFSKDPAVGKRQREREFAEYLKSVAANTELILWMPTRATYPDLRLEQVFAAGPAGRARGIHFHWMLPLDGKPADEIHAVSKLYERVILQTDYPALTREQDRLIAAMRGQELRITSPAGTDLRIRIASGAWFHKNDGDMSPSRAKTANSARDREMEFPAGALRVIPEAASASGKLVLPRALGAENVTLEFENGRVVRWRAENGELAFGAVWKNTGGDVDKIGEIVIGTNPLLVEKTPAGDLPYYGYGSGYVRISLGDNWESGGTLRSPDGRPVWLFLEGATLAAGSQVLIRDGKMQK